jgi:hypothetical protein
MNEKPKKRIHTKIELFGNLGIWGLTRLNHCNGCIGYWDTEGGKRTTRHALNRTGISYIHLPNMKIPPSEPCTCQYYVYKDLKTYEHKVTKLKWDDVVSYYL